jgi:hypothetical protein
LLVVVAIAVLLSSLQGYAVSLSGQRHRVDPHWKRGLSFARIGLHRLQQSAITAGRDLLTWLPIPLQTLEPCIPAAASGDSRNSPGSSGWNYRHRCKPPRCWWSHDYLSWYLFRGQDAAPQYSMTKSLIGKRSMTSGLGIRQQ